MGIFGLCEYAALNSRIHYVKSRMLSGGDWQTLIGGGDLNNTMGSLAGYPVAAGLNTRRPDGSFSLRMTEHSLQQNFIDEMLSHLRFLSGASAECLKELIRVYDLLNLKKVLRAQRGYAGKDRMSELFVDLYDLGRYSLLPMEKWTALCEGAEVGRSFSGSCYEEDFKLDIAEAGESAGLMRLETLLEKSYFENLFRFLKKRGGVDLLRMVIDEFSLEQMVRLRYHFKMDPPAILPLLMLDLSSRWNEKRFMRLMKAEDEKTFFTLLSGEKGFENKDCSGLSALLREMRFERAKKCREILRSGAPVSLRPLTALFLLKQMEIRDLVSLLQIKRFNRVEKIGSLVMPATLGGAN